MAEGEEVATAKPVVTGDAPPLVLVTGASGFIATHVIQQLQRSGNYRVRGTVRSLKNEEKARALRELVPHAKYPLELCEAQLEQKDCWAAAVKDCVHVYHIASPFPYGVPKNADEVIRPAVDGTLNVLAACAEGGTVKRVVVTSSMAAVTCGLAGHPGRASNSYTEEDWSPEKGCGPYEKSKLLAERAAWDYVKELPEEKKFELVVVNPGFVTGPALTVASGSSISFVKDILTGKTSGSVDIYIPIVDVRDVARAEIAAMENPQSSGNRYLLISENAIPFNQILQIIAAEFRPQGYKIGTMRVPKFVAWLASFVVAELKLMYSGIGKPLQVSNEKMKRDLVPDPRSAKESLLDGAYSIIELGIIKKTPQYHGPTAAEKEN